MTFSAAVRKNLLTLVAEYRRHTGASLAEASRRFYGNGSFFKLLKDGEQSLSIKTVDQVLEKMRKAWPKDEIWPMLPVIFMNRNSREK